MHLVDSHSSKSTRKRKDMSTFQPDTMMVWADSATFFEPRNRSSNAEKSKVRRDPTTGKVIIDRMRGQKCLRSFNNRINRKNNAK
mmetsp:Transcript_21892/g.62805  ORF Transcript_21892/g.62805 Transcript_21892/m.62805 type:complete len:85 (-) Transcript_21892:575-829(-)